MTRSLGTTMPTTTTFGPTAVQILTAVHRPSTKQRNVLRALPTSAAGVLIALASAPLAEPDRYGTRGPAPTSDQPTLLVWPAFIANAMGLSEATVRGHLKSLVHAQLATVRTTPMGIAYAANGPIILDNVESKR